MILHIERDAGIDRTGIDVNADRAFASLAEVVEAVNRLQLICSQYRAVGAGCDLSHQLDFRVVRSRETVNPDDVLVFGMIASHPFVIDHTQVPALRDHPTELAIMRVYRRLLSGLPADRHDLEEVVAIDHISCVEDVIEKDIRFERRIGDLHTRAEIEHVVTRDNAVFERAQSLNKTVNAN